MSNGNVFERLWKLEASANKLVLDGNRDPDQLCELLQQFIEKPVAQAVRKVLEEMEPVTVVIDTTINPSKVLKTSKVTIVEALWVNEAFAKILVKATGAVPASVTMKPRRLKNSVKDGKIKDELPTVHEIDPTAFVYMLATELAKVRKGKPSDVLAKGRWCLFYVARFVVSVDWNSTRSEWDVHVWELDGVQWGAEHIVFSCN